LLEISKFGQGASFFGVHQGLQSLNLALFCGTINYLKDTESISGATGDCPHPVFGVRVGVWVRVRA